MTPICKKINEFYFLVYPMTDDLPFYINDYVQLMSFSGLTKKELVYKLNSSHSNKISFYSDEKRYIAYYFL